MPARSAHYKRMDWRQSNPHLVRFLPNIKKSMPPIIAWYKQARSSPVPSFGLLDELLGHFFVGEDRAQLKELWDSFNSDAKRRDDIRQSALSLASQTEGMLALKEIPFLRSILELTWFAVRVIDGSPENAELLLDFTRHRQMVVSWLKTIFYSPFTMINVRKTYWELRKDAEKGDRDAFVELVRVDKSCIVDAWAKDIYLRLLAERDGRLLRRLSQAIVSPVVDRREKKVEAFAVAYQVIAVSNGDLTLSDVCDILTEVSPDLDIGEENLRKMFGGRTGGFAKLMKGIRQAATFRKEVT